MARHLRIEYPNAWYHVMNRGAAHQTIFHHDIDYQLFLDLLEEAHERYQLEIHAYCLMDNHYHLFVQTPLPNLGRIMRHINGVFTQRSNRINKTDGALFKGRYKAILVDVDEYAMQLSRYIHLNPVSAGMVQNPEDYPWSSYKNYLQVKKKPDWLYCDYTLSFFGLKNQISNYHQFVSKGIDENKKFYLNQKRFPILGSEHFIKKTKNNHLDASTNEEIPEKLRIVKYFSSTIEDIINTVSDYYHVPHSTIISRGNKKSGNLPRQIAIFLAFRTLGETRKKIARKFIGLSYQSISALCIRIDFKLKTNELLYQDIEKIKNNLAIIRKSRL